MIGFLLSLLFAFVAAHAPAPVDVVGQVLVEPPAVVVEHVEQEPARDVVHPDSVPPPAPPVPPTATAPAPASCAAGEEWQGEFGCVAVQAPDETSGRAYG